MNIGIESKDENTFDNGTYSDLWQYLLGVKLGDVLRQY